MDLTYQEPVAPLVPINLDILDAELVAVDDVPTSDIAVRQETNLPAIPQPRLMPTIGQESLLRRAIDDPYWILLGLKWGIPTAIVGTAIYGVVQVVLWVSENLANIGMGIGGVIGTVFLLSLLGGGGAVCAGLHCAGCRR